MECDCDNPGCVTRGHNVVKGDMNFPKDDDFTDTPCDGEVMWDSVLEGFLCSKCQLYTGSK